MHVEYGVMSVHFTQEDTDENDEIEYLNKRQTSVIQQWPILLHMRVGANKVHRSAMLKAFEISLEKTGSTSRIIIVRYSS